MVARKNYQRENFSAFEEAVLSMMTKQRTKG
jgi:hypothetical protein